MRPMVPSPLPYGYRNRITVHAQDDVVGFYRRDVHQLMDIERCPIAAPEVNDALAQLRAGRVRDGHYTLRAHSGPRVFAQTNDAIAEALADLIAETLHGEEKLLIDAFCGAGFFTKRLAPQFERVVGIDWDRFAIAAAQKDAAPNEAYISGDVTTELRWLLQQSDLASTALIVDPPATGLSAEMRRAILDAPPRTMIYVSCNPPTLARDIAELQQRFSVLSITPFDMFPQTAEIEVLVHLKSTGPVPDRRACRWINSSVPRPRGLRYAALLKHAEHLEDNHDNDNDSDDVEDICVHGIVVTRRYLWRQAIWLPEN